jgi:hypothetical protein
MNIIIHVNRDNPTAAATAQDLAGELDALSDHGVTIERKTAKTAELGPDVAQFILTPEGMAAGLALLTAIIEVATAVIDRLSSPQERASKPPPAPPITIVVDTATLQLPATTAQTRRFLKRVEAADVQQLPRPARGATSRKKPAARQSTTKKKRGKAYRKGRR